MMRLILIIGLLCGFFTQSVSSVTAWCGTRKETERFMRELENSMSQLVVYEQLMITHEIESLSGDFK